ncbi:MAG: hypothetical protein J6S14_06835 [Clostridia bacterium]|nr:hypothetical protein [Clostridia bacterium]
MAADGQIVFEVTADGKKAIANVKDITAAIEKESKNWDKSVSASADNMTKSMAKALDINRLKDWGLKAGKALLDFANSAIEAASDLQEVQNVVDTTFGDGAVQIESWAKSAGKQFGLTETQAKKFTSTLGAMMKSAGMSGNEIITMSTDLAGLAADMASFYNLDFETAFQKIRSGISGETEPLKQLGINMSVANLEAYALTQGITKAFDSMTQGEQTMLRYQYLMQATADAQGDFAKTADGYANSQRRIATAIETIKTDAGNFLLEVINPITSGIAEMLEKLTQKPDRTVIDDFNEIDIDTAGKLDEITKTATEARDLVAILEQIKTSTAAENLQKIVNGLTNVKLDQRDSGIVLGFLGSLNENINALAAVRGESAEEAQKWLQGIADKANALDPNKVDGWGDLITEITNGIPGLSDSEAGATLLSNLQQIAGTDAAGTITAISEEENKINTSGTSKIASDLEGISKSNAGTKLGELVKQIGEIDTSNGKAKTLESLLSMLSADVWALSAVTGSDAQGVADWMASVKEAASGLSEDDVAGWSTIADLIKTGIPGLDQTEEGKSLLEALGLKEMTPEEQQAISNLEALGISTEGVADKQALWLETCKKLIATIPGLNSIINAETGEVEGGTDAIKDYIQAWEDGQKKLVMLGALEQKENALSSRFADIPGLELDMAVAKRRARQALEAAQQVYEQYGANFGFGQNGKINRDYSGIFGLDEEGRKALNSAADALDKAMSEADEATTAYQRQVDALEEAKLAIEEYRQTVEEMPDGLKDVIDSTEEWSDELKKVGKTAVTASEEAIRAMADYVQSVRDSTAQAVDNIIGGFESIKSPARDIDKQVSDLAQKQQEYQGKLAGLKEGSKEYKELAEKIKEVDQQLEKLHQQKADQGFTAGGMLENLQSQKVFMEEYMKNLQKAREMGLSDELLASLADGSEESFARLSALLEDPSKAEQVDKLYQDVQGLKEGFTDALTAQKLTVDETYQGMVDAAKEAITQMNLGQEASAASGETIAGLAKGISSHVPEVKTAVDSILAELDRLSGWGINIDLGPFGSFGFQLDGSHETGLDFVPFNGYLAELHEGEGILTAEENRIWQGFKNGAKQGVDYEALGGVMRDNVKAGGDVYLDGRTVGHVISAQQGKSYRTLQRSGWQG